MNELELINELNERLSEVQGNVNRELIHSSLPTTYIIGCPRSGTTALMQYLSTTGCWSYPTNFLTRFSQSVYIGSLVQELLFNANFGLIKDNNVTDFKSDYGRSYGALNSNEFFHFFRRFFPNNDIRFLTTDELNKVNIASLLKEIDSIVLAQQKPFLTKGLMLQYNLDFFSNLMPSNIFLYIKREAKFVMQSIYKARIRECDGVHQWWSAKPEEYSFLKNKSVEEQIAGQVYFTELAIESALEKLPLDNKLIVNYEDFIVDPEKTYRDLLNKYELLGVHLPYREIKTKTKLTTRNSVDIAPKTFNLMNNIFHQF